LCSCWFIVQNKIKKDARYRFLKKRVIVVHLFQLIAQIFITNLTFYIFRAVVLYTQAFLRLIAQMLHVSAKNHSLPGKPGDKTSMTRLFNTTFYVHVFCVILIRRFLYNCNTFVIILHVYWMTPICINILPILIDSPHGTLTSRRVAQWRWLYFWDE
jgi:hypothetical protein